MNRFVCAVIISTLLCAGVAVASQPSRDDMLKGLGDLIKKLNAIKEESGPKSIALDSINVARAACQRNQNDCVSKLQEAYRTTFMFVYPSN